MSLRAYRLQLFHIIRHWSRTNWSNAWEESTTDLYTYVTLIEQVYIG